MTGAHKYLWAPGQFTYLWAPGHDYFICGWALSFKMEFLAFQLQRVFAGTGKV